MADTRDCLLKLIKKHDGINDKARLARIVSEAFRLTKDRSVYYSADYALRFSSSASRYHMTTKGRQIVTTLLQAQHATLQQLNALAA